MTNLTLSQKLVILCAFLLLIAMLGPNGIRKEAKNQTARANEHAQITNPNCKPYEHRQVKRWLNKKPAVVNIFTINPKATNVIIKPSYGSYFLNNVKRVSKIVHLEKALAGINASYFKPDIGTPLGVSIIDGKVLTGPLYNRVVFGITENNEFKIDKITLDGDIFIGNRIKLKLYNLNQPAFSNTKYTIFTDRWGNHTPKTSPHYSHIVVENNKVKYIKNSSVPIPRNGYVIVGPHSKLPKYIQKNDVVSYTVKVLPESWKDVKYAVGGGSYLVKNGKPFIDDEKFPNSFLWHKAPRTAVGYTKSGTLIFVTIDGRQKGVSEGATMSELAQIMWELGAYNAMNLDGGTSTQMVVNGKLVNNPNVKGGCKVTNALVIVLPE